MSNPRLITITDEEQGHSRRETLLDGQYTVVSRSGLSATERALIESLPTLKNPRRLLLIGNRTGVVGLIAADRQPGLAVEMLCLDIHHARTARRNLAENRAHAVSVECAPYVAGRAVYDTALLQLSRGGMTGELVEDFLQQIHLALQPEGQLLVALDDAPERLAGRLKELFGGCRRQMFGGQSVLTALKRKPLRKERRFTAELTMTLPGRKPVRLVTIPGVFAHRKVDEGALALAETAVADVQAGDVVLDLGCGAGTVGLALAVNQVQAHVTFVDSNARAVWAAEQNCRLNAVTNYAVALGDDAPNDGRAFTLFVANPPYFSHYDIAERFIQTARRKLAPGGRAYLVAKNAAGHEHLMRRAFGNAEIIRRRGYQVVKSVRRKYTIVRDDNFTLAPRPPQEPD